jgi:hypothetical protein
VPPVRAAGVAPRLLLPPLLQAGAAVAPRLLPTPLLQARAAAAPSVGCCCLTCVEKERERESHTKRVPVLKIRTRQSRRKRERVGAEDICVIVLVVGPRRGKKRENEKFQRAPRASKISSAPNSIFMSSP